MQDATQSKMYLGAALMLVIAEVLLIAFGQGNLPISGMVLFAMFYAFAYMFKYTQKYKGLTFTFQIFAFVSFTMYFPEIFTDWGFNTKVLIVPSVQVIMFGMGTKLNLSDFAREFSKPLKIVLGTVLIYTMMPFAGWLIINVYDFGDDAVAAGFILLGALPAGAASNVMTYLAKGNLALALSITTLSTIAAPFVTPLIMSWLAGTLIAVDGVAMMISIVNMIFVPVIAGLVCNKILYGGMQWTKQAGSLISLAVVCFIAGFALIFVSFPEIISSLHSGLILVFWAVAVVSITKMLVDRANGPANWMELVLPKLSLTSIMLYIIIVAAHEKSLILSIGPAVFIATIAHNALGFVLGFGAAKALRLKDADVRTFTIEVGLKNAGVGVGLANEVLRSSAASLASLVFGTWMNVTGSTLANFWSQKEPRE